MVHLLGCVGVAVQHTIRGDYDKGVWPVGVEQICINGDNVSNTKNNSM